MASDLGSIMSVVTLIVSTLFAWNLIQPAESRYPQILVEINVGSKEAAVMQQGGESTVYNTKKQMDVILIANPALLRERGMSPASSPATHTTLLEKVPCHSAADAPDGGPDGSCHGI